MAGARRPPMMRALAAARRHCGSAERRLRCGTALVGARHGRGSARPYTFSMDAVALRARIEDHVRRRDLIAPGGEVFCLVSGGPDSTCLWHALGALGYRVNALHVNHKLRGEESEEDARFCRERFGAEIVEAPPQGPATEQELRELRYSVAIDRLRATGHTASD